MLITSKCTLIYLTIAAFGAANAINVQHFDDSLVPEKQRNGINVRGIGRVPKMDSILPPTHIGHLETSFDLLIRGQVTRGVEYEPHDEIGGKHHYNLDRLAESKFNKDAKTVVLIAGSLSRNKQTHWTEDAISSWSRIEPTINFIRVSWTSDHKGASSEAIADTLLVARQITVLLYYLYALEGADFRDPQVARRIHLVGHSLGAHVAGFVGQDLGGRLGRITGLDPAGLAFNGSHEDERLDPSDAYLVDALHTNSGPVSGRNAAATWFGINRPVGHVDYYANDGSVQPGCRGPGYGCDHARAYEIFVDILRHEADVLHASFHPSQRASSRLLAFRAKSFDQFSLGYNFHQDCPEIMQLGLELAPELAENMIHCSLPIDYLAPVEEFWGELAARGIGRLSPSRESKYFFRTRAGKSLVGDHFLMKLAIEDWPGNNEEESCELAAKLTYLDRSEVALEVGKIHRISSAYQKVIAIPFVGPEKSRDFISRFLVGAAHPQTRVDNLLTIMPQKVTLIDQMRTRHGAVSRAASRVRQALTWSKPAISTCRMSFNLVQVQPILALDKNFATTYCRAGEFRVTPTNKPDLVLRGRSDFRRGSSTEPLTGLLIDL